MAYINGKPILFGVMKEGGDASKDFETVYTQNGEQVTFSAESPFELTGISCTQLVGVFRLKNAWDLANPELKSTVLEFNGGTASVRIVRECADETTSDENWYKKIVCISLFAINGAKYISVTFTNAPTGTVDMGYFDNEYDTVTTEYLLPFNDEKITSLKIYSIDNEYEPAYCGYDAYLEFEGK